MDKSFSLKKKTRKPKKRNPKLRLKTKGKSALLSIAKNERIPLMLTDIQHLLLHSLLGTLNLSQPARWYVLEKSDLICQTTCLILEGVSSSHWIKYSKAFMRTRKIFNNFLEIVTPSAYNGSLVQEMALVPLSEVDKEEIIQIYGSINLALQARNDLMVMIKAFFPIVDNNKPLVYDTLNDKFPRTQLILPAWQLIDEQYPMPLKGKLKNSCSDYIITKEIYEPVTTQSPLFGLDCEMCLTEAGYEVTRVSIVDEKHETIYETLVKPYNDIKDYLTCYSGITKSLLNDVTKRLEGVRNEIRNLLPADAILVGHSLNLDLHALKMMHPYVIDTSLIFNIKENRARKPKLKTLAKQFLKEDIQSGINGHCPIEDSLASLKLVQLKLRHSIEFGDYVHTSRQKYKENAFKMTDTEKIALSLFNHMLEQKKTSLVVGRDNITGDYHSYIKQARKSVITQLKKGKRKKVEINTVDDDEEVIATVAKTSEKYNFSMAHLKIDMESKTEVEQMRIIDGWIDTIWNCLKKRVLFVVIFGGTDTDNGVAMARVNNTLR